MSGITLIIRFVVALQRSLTLKSAKVHEALIREWLILREWMNANRQFRLWQEGLKVRVLEWKNSQHDTGALLRGVPLGVAEEWLGSQHA